MNGASEGSLHQTQKKCNELLEGALTTEKLVGLFIRATLRCTPTIASNGYCCFRESIYQAATTVLVGIEFITYEGACMC